MKTTIFSPSQLKSYKTSIIYICGFFGGFSIITMAKVFFENEYILIFYLPIMLVLPIHFYREIKKIRSISYDDKTIHVGTTKHSEIQVIPFEDIRSIVLGRSSGVHKFNLITPIEGRKAVFFKTSPWYPFNSKQDDKKVYQLRNCIDAYKRSMDEDYTEQLPVYKIASHF